MKLGLFGSIHNAQMMKELGIDDKRIMELFDIFKPDIVCGEVRKDDYEQNREYQGPSEYRRFIFKYCEERGIKFIPCDQYEDSDIEYTRRMEQIEVTDEEMKEFQRLMEAYMKVGTSSEMPFNSIEFNAIVERKQAFQGQFDPEAHGIIWDNRNNAIVNNVLRVIHDNPNTNILVIFGAEHIYWLKNAFEKMENIEIVFPLS